MWQQQGKNQELRATKNSANSMGEARDSFGGGGPAAAARRRLRRRPQRWEGEAREAPVRESVREGGVLSRLIEEASTASLKSYESTSPPPEACDPLVEAREGIKRARKARSPQEVIRKFHDWQLSLISKQASHQKATHSYLKRRMRKRLNRIVEYDRIEEDAMRNACSAPKKRDSENENPIGTTSPSNGDTGVHHPCIVPATVRLPLEAYLPRRVRSAQTVFTPDDVLQRLPNERHGLGGERELKEKTEKREVKVVVKEETHTPVVHLAHAEDEDMQDTKEEYKQQERRVHKEHKRHEEREKRKAKKSKKKNKKRKLNEKQSSKRDSSWRSTRNVSPDHTRRATNNTNSDEDMDSGSE